MEYYIGKEVIVTVVKGIATSAQLSAVTPMSLEDHTIYRRIVEKLYTEDGELNLPKLAETFFGYTSQRILDLGNLPLSSDTNLPAHPVLLLENHASSDSITRQQNSLDRVIIKANQYLKGNEKAQKLKTALCHQPAKFFTGK